MRRSASRGDTALTMQLVQDSINKILTLSLPELGGGIPALTVRRPS